MSQRYPRIREQITRMTRTLVAVQGWDKAYTMDYVGRQTGYSPDMVYRWQQGRSCPSSQVVEILARIGKEQANLPRDWGESLLKAVHHPDAASIMNKLWGPRTVRSIPSNLPPVMHSEFIGRQTEIARLLELLSPRYAAHLITVDGIGGVGKTALVLEAAYRCWRASTGEVLDPKVPTFEAIIFVSAKQHYLTPDGILPRYEAQRALRDIFRDIAHTLNPLEITQEISQDQVSTMRNLLARQPTLLIVDNLETIEDKQEVLSFLFELPPPIKIVITTRERALSFSPMHLKQLGEEEALYLIERQAQEKEAQVSKEEALMLYKHIGGIPAALAYAIGQIANGYSVKTVLERVSRVSGDVARFCFEGSVEPLRGQHAHSLLMALAMFSKSPLRAALAHTAGLASDPNAVEEGLAQLKRLSLVSQQEDHYVILPLTREYALTELAGCPEFEQAARERWITWYMNFVKEYGVKDWTEWHIQFDRIEEEWENLLAVFDWCAAHNQYLTIRAFWLVVGLNRVAGIYGYWDDHLTWHDWLIQMAEKRGDWPTAVEAMIDKGYTLILMGRLEATEELLKRARNLQNSADHRVQIKLAENIARLRIYQKQYADALNWLDQADVLLKKAIFDEPERNRRQITIQNYRGRICYEVQDYRQAKLYFRETLAHAQSIGFQRGLIYAQKYLADIAIVEGRFEEAASLLETGLITAQRNNDKRRTAFYKQSFAYFHKRLGQLEEARYWAREALDSFEHLGMQLETKEMHALLQELQV